MAGKVLSEAGRGIGSRGGALQGLVPDMDIRRVWEQGDGSVEVLALDEKQAGGAGVAAEELVRAAGERFRRGADPGCADAGTWVGRSVPRGCAVGGSGQVSRWSTVVVQAHVGGMCMPTPGVIRSVGRVGWRHSAGPVGGVGTSLPQDFHIPHANCFPLPFCSPSLSQGSSGFLSKIRTVRNFVARSSR